VTADDRTSAASKLAPSAGSSVLSVGSVQTASFGFGDLRVELTASPGAARVIVANLEARDVYVVDPMTLAAWSRGIERLLALPPATAQRDHAEYRSPFLMDREGRASIAVEALVGERVSFRLVIQGAESRIGGVMATRESVRGLADAAAGIVSVANPK
jgi:hypothetical protein